MASLVTIAIPDLAGRAATMESLALHTPEPHQVVLLTDATPAGPALFSAPAALNRLVTQYSTPYILLLEAGAVVTAGWLHRLLAPFEDESVGLSGPSTNMAWNEQQVVSQEMPSNWSRVQIDAYAAALAAEHADRWIALDTLHSLCDFCYLFKRSVAEQIGGFDEAYGAGPCWEIDFNTRAARAGYLGVWVPGAYVHRAPPSPARVQALRLYFADSKRLYQDRFCGLRLRGEKRAYEPHCLGEACEYFAPPDLIRIVLSTAHPPPVQEAIPPWLHLESGPAPEATGARSGNTQADTEPPLISCIMPTRNRRAFIHQALLYFERQDYARRELIIVDDGDDPIGDLIPDDPRIRLIRLPNRLSIGAKRNIACDHARGELIAHWDDDDWYSPARLSYQAAPLLRGEADISGLETTCFFDIARGEGWACSSTLHRRLFAYDVHSGTLVYRRSIWENLARYPDVSIAEDAALLKAACRRGARLARLPNADSFVYIRHRDNAWQFASGSFLDPQGWQRTDPAHIMSAEDLEFYAAFRQGTRPHTAAPLSDAPLITCIMPTHNRRAYVPLAIVCFLRQDYPERELLILDDGSDPVADLIPDDPRIRYVRLEERRVLGAKRNLACSLARGALIAHWDDDDWSAPHRLSYQVAALQAAGGVVCGANRQLYYDPAEGRAWLYQYPAHLGGWVAGNTLVYRKSFWEAHHFPGIQIGEDTLFVRSVPQGGLIAMPDYRFHVGCIHRKNTSPKVVTGPRWRPHPRHEVYDLLGADLSALQQAAQSSENDSGSKSGGVS